jgi:3-deoxy-D-manno-octulosonate 8-phosphate phosphatase (KDO 8-P phosphatase)
MNCEAIAASIRLLVLDVDGVLTAGQIIFNGDGEMLKIFHCQDGLGITAARRAGLKIAVITGRHTAMVERRCAELGIDTVYQGIDDKLAALQELLAGYELTPAQVAYVGDDLNDLAVMAAVGLPCAVGNAVPEVKDVACYVAQRFGGGGAVREIIELILKAQGRWADVVAAYTASGGVDTRQ